MLPSLARTGRGAALETVKITDTGEGLLITGPTQAAVDEALKELLSRGSKATSSATQLGSKWLASCTHPAPAPESGNPAPVDVAAIAQRVALRSVSISDAGSHLIVTGESRESVQAALLELSKTGAEPTLEITQVGRKWMGRCENLKFGLREVKVEQFGLSYVISGQNREAVEAKLQEFELKGASVLVGIQKVGNEWVVTVDTGGGYDDVHKW